jgi:hypothetical protein
VTTQHDPIDVVCGRSWEFSGPLLDADDRPLPLAGAAISWKLDSLDGSANYLSLTLGNGISINNETWATIVVAAPPSATVGVPAGIYRDWLTVTLADGTVLDEWSGIIRVAAAPGR